MIMNENKQQISIPILKEDKQQLLGEANYLGVAMNNYILLILFISREKSYSLDEIEEYKAKLDNNKADNERVKLNISNYLINFHSNVDRGIYSFNQYLATVIHQYLKNSNLPRQKEQSEMLRKGLTVPHKIPDKFDEIFNKTSIFPKTLINYKLSTEGYEYKDIRKYSGENQTMFIQYPVELDKYIPYSQQEKISLLEQVLEKYI